MEPNLTCFFLSIWEIIVGIIALSDCLGPYVLKGLAITNGKLKLLKKDDDKLSDAIFVALYGDCACKGCASSIGVYKAEP